MTKQTAQRSDLKAVRMLLNESSYVGIDICKAKHVAGFLSKTLLERHERFEACPPLVFENSREGFRLLIERIRSLAPLEHIFVLMERTGHYHRTSNNTSRNWISRCTSCMCKVGLPGCSKPTNGMH